MGDAAANPASEQAGARLGKYAILSRIGAGGMSVIYRAKDETTGRIVALKVLPQEHARNPVLRKRFDREAQTAARVRHPNVVAVYELGKVSGTRYIAMELIEGLNLHQYIQDKGKLDTAEALEILRQAALALHQAHKNHIVHRDIKPSNFLIAEKDGQRLVKLTDLGLARDELCEDDTRLTRAHTTLGTADYMAPEQAKGSWLADIRSDLYALGCTFYHMLTGRPPFPEGTAVGKFYKHAHHTPDDPREFNPALPDDVLLILARLLQKNPADRYQTPRELLLDLRKLRQRKEAKPPAAPAAAPPDTESQAAPSTPPAPRPEGGEDIWAELARSAPPPMKKRAGRKPEAASLTWTRRLNAFFDQPVLVVIAAVVVLAAIVSLLWLLLE